MFSFETLGYVTLPTIQHNIPEQKPQHERCGSHLDVRDKLLFKMGPSFIN